MVIRSCPICSKEFSRKDRYDYHINRKNPCVKKEDMPIEKLIKDMDAMKIEITELKNIIRELMP